MPEASATGSGRAAIIEELAGRAQVAGRRTVVLVDGRSGSGKTTLGTALAEALDAQYVGLDDVYPGWNGLETAAGCVAPGILRADRPGYRRWDWERGAPSSWRSLDSARAIVVEGAGSLTPAAAPLATLRVWLDLDEPTRRERALARDGDSYAPWWEIWAAQEEAHLAANDPRALADVVVDVSTGLVVRR
ncbi:Cytidylate kinase [Frondihabitans sp. 762G35]|uniref:ATP-binding protein n=1 Tax=Frondihabitans sp. 762G35 TaxID=1446794 RepID=UPI000D207541|nr:ATP-binding protein [Frondihabitans sp. 762G35]ARC56401.1 Cytidylate kinase [Frondihabitans sp. 762G35]